MIAMPMPITKVAAKSIAASGAAPRSADPRPVSRMPPTSTRKAPKRAMRIDPGTAANEKSSTGRLASAPISACESARLWWIMGITGGTARTVVRRQSPKSQSRMKGRMGEAYRLAHARRPF